jgi:hypothetical protein
MCFHNILKTLSSKHIKEMYNINISFDTKHEKKANGYTSYGFYICECTQILQFEMFSNLG